jgi:Tfp pilus assembly protein PilE
METRGGFSIIEFLVISAICAILGLIAIPQYSIYRQRGYAATAAADLRNVAAAEESFFAQNARYQPISGCRPADAGSRCDIPSLPAVSPLSKGVSLEIAAHPSGNGFTGLARHVNSDIACRWDSTQGGMLGCAKAN